MKIPYQGTQPAKQRGGDIGADLRAKLDSTIWLAAGERRTINLGTILGLPDGVAAWVLPRSGLASRHGITILNAPGLVDSNYRGEIMAVLHNTDSKTFKIDPGDRVAQLVLTQPIRPTFVESDDLGWTDRGANGLGSSGVN